VSYLGTFVLSLSKDDVLDRRSWFDKLTTNVLKIPTLHGEL